MNSHSYPFFEAWDQIENETMTLIFQFPQIRPRSHLCGNNKLKYVGSCIDGSIHFNGINDKNELKDF